MMVVVVVGYGGRWLVGRRRRWMMVTPGRTVDTTAHSLGLQVSVLTPKTQLISLHT